LRSQGFSDGWYGKERARGRLGRASRSGGRAPTRLRPGHEAPIAPHHLWGAPAGGGGRGAGFLLNGWMGVTNLAKKPEKVVAGRQPGCNQMQGAVIRP